MAISAQNFKKPFNNLNHLKYYYIFFSLFFFSLGNITANNITRSDIDSLKLDVKNRVLVTITEKKNIISLDVAQGIKSVKIISATPLEGLDFRDYPSVVIRVEVDGFEKLNVKIMDFVKGRNKKKKIAHFLDDQFAFSDFTNLKIIIEDTKLDLKYFKIDLWLYLR